MGRVSGKPHKVALRLVYYQGRFYASRRDAASDWCKNLLANPAVAVEVPHKQYRAIARVIDDRRLARVISGLKYQDERAMRPRVIIEIVPNPE